MSVWKKFYLFLKVVIGLAVLGVIFATFEFVQTARAALTPEVTTEEIKQALEQANSVDLQPGEKVFARARDLLATGNLVDGRKKLTEILNFHPTTRSASEARRILGEMNLDELLDPTNMKNKSLYEVKRGDSFIPIVNRNETSFELLMSLNNLSDFRGLHPGDELLAMPLNFTVVVDLDNKTVELWEDDSFVKAYPIQELDSERKIKTGETSLSGKMGLANGRSYPESRTQYREAEKVLTIDGRTLQIRQESDEEDLGDAAFLRASDMEELAMLVRRGNAVIIRKRGE